MRGLILGVLALIALDVALGATSNSGGAKDLPAAVAGIAKWVAGWMDAGTPLIPDNSARQWGGGTSAATSAATTAATTGAPGNHNPLPT